MSQDKRIEEDLLSQAAESTLSNQLDKVEKVDVDIQTDLLKIIQGQADAVSFAGEGLEFQEIRVQEIEIQTDKIAINPLSAIFGQIEFTQPVNTTVRIVLTDVDINHALTSDFIRSRIKPIDLNVDSEIVSLYPQEIQLYLPSNDKIQFKGTILIQKKGKTSKVGFTAVVSPRTKHHPIRMESFNCTQGEGISLNIIASLMNQVKEWTNLPHFEVDDVWFRILNMEVQKGSLILLVEAKLKQIPAL